MRLYIATPSYSQPVPDYYRSLFASIPALERAGFLVEWQNLRGCCYLHTARNKLARDFLLSDADDLLFIDGDLGWEADELVRLAQHQQDLVGGAAPFRVGDEGFPAHFLQDGDGYPMGDPESGLIEVDVLPTAIMKIKRGAFMRLAAAGKAPLRIEASRKTGKETERYLSFFDFEADNANNVEYGEDVSFCRKWTALGGQMWVEPRMTIRHHDGEGAFREGNLDKFLRAKAPVADAA